MPQWIDWNWNFLILCILVKASKSRAAKVFVMSLSSSLKGPNSFQDTGNYLKGLGWITRGSSGCLTALWVSWHLYFWTFSCVSYICRWNFSTVLKEHYQFSCCLFAFTIRNISWWMKILCVANCWPLKLMPLPLFMFCTLGYVVISVPFILLPFLFLLVWGIVLTLRSWDCKIRMTMCEIKTSVYHFAISTLQFSSLAAIKSLSSLSYTFISWFAFIFFFFLSSVLQCFLKAGRSAELPPLIFILNTNAQGLRSMGLKQALK